MRNTFRSCRPSALLFLLFFSLTSSGCVTVLDEIGCTPNGVLLGGASCAHLLTSATLSLTFNETMDLLEAQPARTCVPVPGLSVCADDQTTGTPIALPARASSVILPADSYEQMKTELEEACRELGSKCGLSPPAITAARMVRH